MGKRKTNQLSLRLPPPLLDELEIAADVTGFDEQEIAKALIKTFVRQVNSGDSIRFPFRLESDAKKSDEPKILPRMGGTGNTPFTDSTRKSQYPEGEETLHAHERETLPLAAERHTRGTKPTKVKP